MVTEEHEMPNGWPLGLGIMSIRLRVVESLTAAAEETHSLHMPSTSPSSMSSFSSSNLDTESTVSFFQDRSVSLGRLIGLRPGERGGFYFPNSIRFEDDKRPSRDAHTDDSGGQRADMSQGICMPQLLGALVKMNRSKSKSRK